MDEFFGVIVVCIVMIFAVLGVVHTSLDFRHFDEIKSHCEKYGYVQNSTVRITCSVDKPKGS